MKNDSELPIPNPQFLIFNYVPFPKSSYLTTKSQRL